MQFSRRTNWPLDDNPIIKAFQKAKKEYPSLINLTESNPTRCHFQYPEELLQALNNPANFSYHPDAQGMRSAREIIAGYYQRQQKDVKPEQIILTSSTSEAYSYIFRVLADPYDEILFPRPSYPLFQFLVDLNDVLMIPYSLAYKKEGWFLDSAQFENIVSTKSKAVVLVNPNNPTGSYFREQEISQLNKVCLDYNMALICDEVFFDFPLQECSRKSMVGNSEVLTFTLNGLSKMMGLPQMKLSWIVINGPDDLVQQAKARLEVIADTYLSVNTPVQNALQAWFDLKENIQAQIKQRVSDNYIFLQETFKDHGAVELLKADGGWYAVLRLSSRYQEQEWVLKLLEDHQVFVHPGFFFDFDV
ncbi:MAG: pyridoxal phosphate-dependent aminotransferase, partial [Candidatus Omnitrophica bacterium]|nr:pyridoxal phosphate-dependent aminotransferase [Candidatus Omnitrophota bacterium]